MSESKRVASRRQFIKTAVASAVATGGVLALGGAPAIASNARTFKVGLIGSGGRGSKAKSLLTALYT